MRKLIVACAVILGGWLAVNVATSAEDEKPNIKAVMKTCMKGGLCKKVASGEATAEEKEKLVAQFTALSEAKPPKGEADSWKAKTAALLEAAKECAEGKEGAGEKLGKAANCMACHSAHKGK
jgi:hypothetical protein